MFGNMEKGSFFSDILISKLLYSSQYSSTFLPFFQTFQRLSLSLGIHQQPEIYVTAGWVLLSSLLWVSWAALRRQRCCWPYSSIEQGLGHWGTEETLTKKNRWKPWLEIQKKGNLRENATVQQIDKHPVSSLFLMNKHYFLLLQQWQLLALWAHKDLWNTRAF